MNLFITVPADEAWDEEKEQFVFIGKPFTLQFAHSLISISKWEAKYCIPFPFINGEEMQTADQFSYYLRCMCITQNVPDDVWRRLEGDHDNLERIVNYINAPMSATTITYYNSTGNAAPNIHKQIITSEMIYYWLSALNLPHEYEKWHINRLLKLIELANVENHKANGTGGKRSPEQTLADNQALNRARKAKLRTRG